jgi:hypothetical protein
MATVPSIKGSIFGRGVEDLLKLVAQGEISRADLERKLEPGDSAYLDEPIVATGWYDVQVYGRVLDLLREIVGCGSNTYLRDRGARSAETLLKAGLHQQLEYLSRTQLAAASTPEDRYRAFGRDLKLLVSMHRALLNFGEQISKPDPDFDDRYILEISGAEPYPEALCWTTDGFINRMAQQHHTPDLWRWERPTPERLLFRMTRPA